MSFDSTGVLMGAGIGVACVGAAFFVWRRSNGTAGGNAKQIKSKEGTNGGERKFPAGKLSIYFGSQTGTAEGFARVLMEEGRNHGFDAKMVDLDNFDAEELMNCKLAIFLMATYGEGEPTDNAARFAKWIDPAEKDASAGCLSNTNFTVFGLGNRQYEHFNRMGKTTNKELERLGGVRVHEYGEGDDDNALEDDFENWKGPMWASLTQKFHPNQGASDAGDGSGSSEGHSVTLSFECVEIGESEAKKLESNPPRTSQLAASTRHFFTCKSVPVVANRELRANEAQMLAAKLDKRKIEEIGRGSTRHVEVDIAGSGLVYTTADNLAVLPLNDAGVVAELCRALGYSSRPMTVKPLGDDFKYTFPVPFTPQQALQSYFDIHGQPSTGVLKQLLPYVQDDKQKEWLRGFLDKDQRGAWKSFLETTGASVASLLLGELSSCRPPLADLLHILPFLQPRYYTISSSSSVHPDTVHITVSVTEFKLPNGKVFRGVASGFLQTLKAGSSSCRVFVRPSTFRLPPSLNTPIIMVGPGTGLAPMRALLQERRFQARNGGAGSKVPSNKNTLYFGCKHSAVDFIYKEELQAFKDEGVLSHFYTAFSREQQTKVYVQHLLSSEDNGTDLAADLDAGAYIFVCGATKMGSDVMDTITSVLEKKKGLSKEKAQSLIKDLQKKGRYVQELWSADG